MKLLMLDDQFELDSEEITSVYSIKEMVDELKNHPDDYYGVSLDYNLDNEDGIQALQALYEARPDIKLINFHSLISKIDIINGFREHVTRLFPSLLVYEEYAIGSFVVERKSTCASLIKQLEVKENETKTQYDNR